MAQVSLRDVSAQVIRINSPVFSTAPLPKAAADADAAVIARARLRELELDPLPERGLLPPSSRIASRPSATFVNRYDELREIGRFLTGDDARMLSIHGTGGSGKTALAAEAAYRFGRFFAGGVFWLNFADPGSAEGEVASCGSSAHLDLDESSKTLSELASLVLRSWSGELPVLLVFDNCEDEASLDRWLPRFGASKVLVTSRRREWSREFGAESVMLTELAPQSGTVLLGKYRPDLTDDPALEHLVARVGAMPFALDLVGKFLEGLRGTSAHTSDEFERYLVEALDASIDATDRVEPDLAKIWGLVDATVSRMKTADPDGAKSALMTLAAQYAPTVPVPVSLLQVSALGVGIDAAGDDVRFARLIGDIADTGLLTDLEGHSIRLHPLVHEFMLATDAETRSLLAASDVFAELFDTINATGDSRTGDVLLPHLRHVALRLSDRAPTDGEPLFHELAQYLVRRQSLDEALSWAKMALDASEALHGAGDPRTARARNLVGYTLLKGGKYEAAIPELKAARELYRELGDPVNEAAVIDNLGQARAGLDRLIEALPLHEKALEMRIKHLGEASDRTAVTLLQMGTLHMAMGAYYDALHYAVRSLRAREQVFPGPAAGLRISHFWIGFISGFLCNWAAATEAFEAVVVLDEELEPTTSRTALTARAALGIARDAGHPPSDDGWREPLRLLPAEQIQVEVNNLAVLALRGGNPALAGRVLDAVPIDLDTPGTIAPFLLNRMRCALELFDHALADRLGVLLAERSDSLNRVTQVRVAGLRGDLSLARDEPADALRLHRIAVELADRWLGPSSTEATLWQTRLALSLAATDDQREADRVLERVVERSSERGWDRERGLGLLAWATARRGEDRAAEARRLATESQRVLTSALGSRHVETDRAASLVATLTGDTGRPRGRRS